MVVDGDANIVSREEVLALRAEAHLTQRPPVLQRIVRLKELQFASGGLGKQMIIEGETNE